MPVDHYENFPVASVVLPRRLRAPIEAIYRYARSADDIADEGDAGPAARLSQLDAYARSLDAIDAGATCAGDPVSEPLARAVHAYDLPTPLLRDLLDAFRQDVHQTRYADFDQLVDYCRRSANPIGRLLLQLYGRARAPHLEHSDAICTALQLINHWQDVTLDWQRGRVYLPQTDLARHEVTEAHIAHANADARWRALMRFEVERARSMLESGAPLA